MLQEEYGVKVVWRMFPLHPETGPKGQKLEDLFNISTEQVQAMMANLQSRAEAQGLPYASRTMTYNSRSAQELGIWARELGCAEEYDMAVFHAYFGEAKNIAERTVLEEIIVKLGLDPEQAIEHLQSKKYAQAVDFEWELSRTRAVRAVPTFFMEEVSLVGAQDYMTLQRLVESKGYKGPYTGRTLPVV